MVGYYILNDKGEVESTTIDQWGIWMNNPNNVIIKQEYIGNAFISTVFLGISYGVVMGKPLFYETMIFGGEHDSYQVKYTSKEEALEGHKKAVALVKGDINADY